MIQNGFILLFVGVNTGSSPTVFVGVKTESSPNRCLKHSVIKDTGEDIETNILA